MTGKTHLSAVTMAVALCFAPRLCWGKSALSELSSMDGVTAAAAVVEAPPVSGTALDTSMLCAGAGLSARGGKGGCGGFCITETRLGETGWDFLPIVEEFQARIPADVTRQFSLVGRRELERGVSMAYAAKVRTSARPESEETVAERTQLLIGVPYEVFSRVIPAEEWGGRLAHYLGGEVRVVEKDRQGRALRQLERMVLSGVPFADIDIFPANQDMTKAEIIVYGADYAKVYWRVYYSDNGSTKADIGSVEFRAYDERSVLVTFHSAHRIRGLEHTPGVAGRILERTFLSHAKQYRALAR